MLWYKSWLETRWRFLIGLVVLICSATELVLLWPRVTELLPLASQVPVDGPFGRKIREAAEIQRQYPGYVWSQWFAQNLTNLGTIFAALLGTGGLLSHRSGGMFMLSLPASRKRLLGTRAAAGLVELFVLTLLPSLFFPLLSPLVGKTYGMGDVLVHSLCLFIVAAVFYSLALLLSTVFGDIWRPLLIALAVALALGCLDIAFPGSRFGIFHVMSGEAWFRDGQLPWHGLLFSVAASTALLYGAALNITRRDF